LVDFEVELAVDDAIDWNLYLTGIRYPLRVAILFFMVRGTLQLGSSYNWDKIKSDRISI
jgi:hypothetical protein